MASSVTDVVTLLEFQKILQSGRKVVVKFTASWCKPCKVIAPTYKNLATNYSDNIVFLEVDVDEAESDIVTFAGVTGIPRFIAYYKNKKVDDLTGADEQKLKLLVQKLNDLS